MSEDKTQAPSTPQASSSPDSDAPQKRKRRKKKSTQAPRRYNRRMEDINPPEPQTQAWLVSFTDVMALMLTFFVLLFSMSHPREDDWTNMTAALKDQLFNFRGAEGHGGPQDVVNLARLSYSEALPLNYVKSLLEEAKENNAALRQVTVEAQAGRLILSLPQDLLFGRGNADIRDEGVETIYALAGPLSRMKNQIEVVGHTDPTPVRSGTGAYDSNWELSMARAARVAALLKTVGYGKPVTIRGMASGRYEDLEGVIVDPAERTALARRVDIVVMPHDGSLSNVFGDRLDQDE